jgi:hypothetical protein
VKRVEVAKRMPPGIKAKRVAPGRTDAKRWELHTETKWLGDLVWWKERDGVWWEFQPHDCLNTGVFHSDRNLDRLLLVIEEHRA